ncbi:MAG: sigma-54 dependent transcriptional regulator [bacterium]|nr:sigma-54 dependent transcriptional regulator [bacterium]
MDHVLLVGKDKRFWREMAGRLSGRGICSRFAQTAAEGVREVRSSEASAVFTEVFDAGAEEPQSLLDAMRKSRIGTPLVVVGENLSSTLVLSAISGGAFDCLHRPVADRTLDALLTRLQAEQGAGSTLCPKEERLVVTGEPDMVVGRSPDMLEALKTVGAVADTGATVLVLGESGTGKELLARAVHRASGRAGKLVAVNCAAVAETLMESEFFGHERGAFTGASERRAGCFEQADGGTLFLDEVGDASLAFQAKLLRVLDRGEFYRVGGRDPIQPDVRVVAATNRNLEKMVEAGTFRGDLYFRLCEVIVHLPPLRNRRLDLPRLAGNMLAGINLKTGREVWGISKDALERLKSYSWPGNIRELQNVLTRSALRCRGGTICLEHVGVLQEEEPCDCGGGIRTLQEVERGHILEILDTAGWNRGRACQMLGISRPTLRRKMRQYGLEQAPNCVQAG